MKNLVDYINENLSIDQKKHLTRFKIDDLLNELSANSVSKTRHNEIKKYFEMVLGSSPYYCISSNNSIGKSAIKITSGKYLLKTYDLKYYDKWIDEYKKKGEMETANSLVDNKSYLEQHNNRVNSFDKETIEKIKKLQSNLDLTIKPHKFGYKGTKTSLKAEIAEINNKFIPVIIQEWEAKTSYDLKNQDELITYYFSAHDIDEL